VPTADAGSVHAAVRSTHQERHVADPTELPPFVAASWVQEHRDQLLVADVRWALDGSQGRAGYLEGHLPGAVFVDLPSVLSGAGAPVDGRHPLPDPARFARSLGDLGIAADDVVVAYDQGPGTVAARLVWMLRAIGQRAAVLDGGLAAWEGPLESGEVQRLPVERPVVAWPPRRLADADDVAAAAADPQKLVVDARDPERFRGELEPVDPRPGHIPGAVNVPASGNVDDDGRLRGLDALRVRYADAGALEADDVIVYCGSGVTATHDLLVLELLGVDGRLFPASWSGWSADPARPAATGP
jgi:thiosulfate/3-mercaptopyruvate sulfurtransferase